MLANSTPFLMTYTAAMVKEFREFRLSRPDARKYLLTAFPVATMPDRLLKRILKRADISAARKASVLSEYQELRNRFFEILHESGMNMILCLPELSGDCRVNFSLDLTDISLNYTPEEYAEHLHTIIELIKTERNFHLTLLPETPFQDIQIITLKDAVAVLRGREPFTSFVFLNPILTQSVSDYFSGLIRQYADDRESMINQLEKLLERR